MPSQQKHIPEQAAGQGHQPRAKSTRGLHLLRFHSRARASHGAAPTLPLLWGAGEVPRSRGEAGGCLGCAPWGAEALRGPQRPPRGGQRRQECARRPARNATLVSCYFGSRGPGPLRAPPAPPGAHISPSYCVASEICYFKPAGRRYVSARGADTSQPAVTF